ncbi:MAG: SDR family NAD(P)-dependent oxidoreductase [Pseudoruegeria sp.]
MIKPITNSQIWVTGASGVLGGEIARHFAYNTDRAVHAVVRRESASLQAAGIKRVLCRTVFDPNWMVGGFQNDTIIHCAGMSDPRKRFASTSELLEQEVTPHIRMLEGLLKMGWKGRFVYLSSGGTVYGNPESLPIKENHSCDPINDYGMQKLFLEQSLSRLAREHDFELVILRVANPYGSTASKITQGVIPILFTAFQNNDTFPIFGDGSASRDYLYVDDFNDAVYRAATRPMANTVTKLNIGSGIGVSLNQLIQEMGTMLGRKLNCTYEQNQFNVSSNVLCPEKAKITLDWQATTSLSSGLNRTLDFYSKQSLGIA